MYGIVSFKDCRSRRCLAQPALLNGRREREREESESESGRERRERERESGGAHTVVFDDCKILQNDCLMQCTLFYQGCRKTTSLKHEGQHQESYDVFAKRR